MAKIIFLDIDGVLNSRTYFNSRKQIRDIADNLDPVAIGYLNQLIKDTGAYVVISSTWRMHHSKEELIELLSSRGFKGVIIGCTPVLSSPHTVRGNEIHSWMRENPEIIGTPVCDFNSYVILDDDSDMLYWHKDNFILVDGFVGLTPNVVYRATRLLGKTASE